MKRSCSCSAAALACAMIVVSAILPSAYAAPTQVSPTSGATARDPSSANTAGKAAMWDLHPTPAATQADAWLEHYTFRDGQMLHRLKLHYATLGTPHRDIRGDIDNAVLVLHWTGSDSRNLLSPVYMKALFDPGRPLDAGRYYLIFPDNVGHGQSSKPSDGLKAHFPDYAYADLVDLQHKLVSETLGIKHLHAILGMSMGGMNAWQWAEAYPDMMDGVMPVVSLPIPVSGRNLLWRRMVIDSIRADPQWNGGDYTQAPRGWVDGYKVLRMMIDSAPALQAEIPDQQAAGKFLETTALQAEHADANDILYSIKSSFDYDPGPGLAKITTRLFALNFDDDEFNPASLHVLEKTVPTLKQGRYVVQPGTPGSPGHYTMTRPDLWAGHVAEFMRWIEAPRP